MKLKTVLLLQTIILLSLLQSQTVRPEINKIVRKIEQSNSVNSDAIGFGGVRTSVWNNYILLKENA